jgi:tRNA(His) 5'-end guanylyltransferase
MKYAFISGDEYTKFAPIAFVEKDEGIEAICESKPRKKYFEDYFSIRQNLSFDNFISSFSYFTVDSGNTSPEVEDKLEKLRSEYAS